MFCIVGLGNPGPEYHSTRHNAGFLVVERIAKEWGFHLNKHAFQSSYCRATYQGQDLILAQPQTFMNLSGEAVGAMVRYFKIPPANVLVIYDDLDLPLGMMRFRLSGSAGGHRGLTSIIKCLGTQEIPRVRVGIGRPAGSMAVVDYVLSRFTEAEQPVFNDILNYGAKAAAAFITEGPAFTMNHFNINLNKPKPERKSNSGSESKPASEDESEE